MLETLQLSILLPSLSSYKQTYVVTPVTGSVHDFMISRIMKNKRHSLISLCGVSLLLAACLTSDALALESVPKRSAPFKLNAQVNQHPELSRAAGDELLSHLNPVDPVAPDGSRPANTAAQPPMPANPYAMPTGNMPPLQGSALASNQAPSAPQAYLSEYGVDWSGWISQMAARWHYNLRRLESQSNIAFVTQRPALIQFTCASNGQVGNFSLKQSSGIFAYDQLQMLALSQVTPLPPFPKGTRCATITLVQGWESHAKKPGESGFDPRAFGRRFPMEKVQQWVRSN